MIVKSAVVSFFFKPFPAGRRWFLLLNLFWAKSFDKYRVSHSKVNKVIWLCWGYSFWFLLIFCVLWVHEKGTFMPNSYFFICLMLHALYGPISQYFLFLNKFGIILTFRGLFQAVKSNKPSKNIFFFKLKVFWSNEAAEVIEATKVVEAVEVIEAI